MAVLANSSSSVTPRGGLPQCRASALLDGDSARRGPQGLSPYARPFTRSGTYEVVRRRFGDTAVLPPVLVHHLFAVVALGQIRVMRVTHQANILRAVVAPTTVWAPVMELEFAALRAASPFVVHERASMTVPLAHDAPDRRRNVPRRS